MGKLCLQVHALVLSCAVLALHPALSSAQTVTVVVDRTTIAHPDARRLLGNSFDARANFALGGQAIGYFSPVDGAVLPIGQYWLDHHPRTSLRYPQGPVNVWSWKESVGPVASRPPQPVLGQVATFGLDDLLAIVAASPEMTIADLNVMVNLYRDVAQPDIAGALQDAADLVEYLNLLAVPGNAWANQRAANGQPTPYGVELFCLGNEPWGFTEYDYRTAGDPDPTKDGALLYANDAGAFLAAMKAIDPAVRITLPIPGPAAKAAQQPKVLAWQQTMLDELGDEAYALVVNLYYDGRIPTQRGVEVMEGYLDQLDALLDAHQQQTGSALRVIVGEHAHAINVDYSTSPPTNVDPDFAMQWHGAVDTVDFIAMLSQRGLVERAHFFIYGNAAAVWHPIRFDGVDGNGQAQYTVMPAASLYQELGQFMLPRSLATSSVSTASDGAAYAVRAAAFADDEQTEVAVLVVNRDPTQARDIDVVGLDGYDLTSAALLTAAAADAESFDHTPLAAVPMATSFTLPPLSILLAHWQEAEVEAEAPVFADGFESGAMSAWSSSAP